jgi:hypothetical protein
MVNYPFQWKIYYSDGSTFTDADGSWESSPPWGVQAIVFLRPDVNPPKLGGRGWEICQGGSFFRKTDDGHFVACDNDALLDYVADALDILFEVRFDNDGSLDGYTIRPTVTVDKPVARRVFVTRV